MKTIKQYAIEAAEAHTNLSTWAAVVTLLEGGHLYGRAGGSSVKERVIAIAKREQQKHLMEYDKAIGNASKKA